jgi:shikimate kinase
LVVLSAPLDVLRARVNRGEGRPAWGCDVHVLFEARRPVYERADLVVSTATRSPLEVAEEIRSWMMTR